MTMLGAGYLSAQGAQGVRGCDDQDATHQMALDDNQSSSYYYGGHRGYRRGYGGYGHYGPPNGYSEGYEAPVEKLPPIIEEVRVPVVRQQEVIQEVIKVVRPEIRVVKVPRTIRKTIVGSPVVAPLTGAPVAGPPMQGLAQGDGGQQGPPQGGDGQQGPPQGGDAQQGGPQGGGGQMPSFGTAPHGGGQGQGQNAGN